MSHVRVNLAPSTIEKLPGTPVTKEEPFKSLIFEDWIMWGDRA
jgi:hypothetical protein